MEDIPIARQHKVMGIVEARDVKHFLLHQFPGAVPLEDAERGGLPEGDANGNANKHRAVRVEAKVCSEGTVTLQNAVQIISRQK